MRVPRFLQHGGPLQRRLRGGVLALAVAVFCLLPVVGCFGFAADIAPGTVPGGESAVSERPHVLEQVDESAFSAVPAPLSQDAAALPPAEKPGNTGAASALPPSGAATPDTPRDASGPPDLGDASAAQNGRPISADTIGPTPAVLPDKDDLPSTEAPESSAAAVSLPKIKLFGTVEFKRPLSSLPAWLDLLKRNQADPIFVPEKHFNKKVTWAQFKEKTKGKSPMDLLRYVNSFWNTWPYREDIENWGQEDYWEIPAEFLKKSGDCEDYSIIKYFTLKELGIPPETMRIVVVRDTIRNMAHAVLVVYMNNDAYVLDSLSNVVLSHTRFGHYSPQYSVNEFGRWAHLKGRKLK